MQQRPYSQLLSLSSSDATIFTSEFELNRSSVYLLTISYFLVVPSQKI